MQGTGVQSLVQVDPICYRATKLERSYQNPLTLEPELCNKSSHRNEKPECPSKEWPPSATLKKAHGINEDPAQPKVNKYS